MNPKGQLALFFVAVFLTSATMGVHESIFNNFLADTFRLSAGSRGWLEFPRELPGLLVVVMTGLLAALPVTRLGVVGAAVLALGLAGLGLLGSSWTGMLAMMLLGSAGMHLLQPVGDSLSIGLANEGGRGRRMGQAGAVGTVGMIVGTGFVWLFFDAADPPYAFGFLCAAGVAALAALVFSSMHVPHLHRPRTRLVVRRQYGLYYVLEFLFGARKQVFITFGPWVLIQVYGQPASAIAGLLMIAAVLGVAFKPLVGWAIDRFGERVVLVLDGIVLAFVCIGYGYAGLLLDDAEAARRLASTCFVLDQLLFALGTGRAVYVSRLVPSPQELTSTLSVGISINHIASMTIPAFAGAVWVGYGYQNVFLGAAVLALAISACASFVPGMRTMPVFAGAVPATLAAEGDS